MWINFREITIALVLWSFTFGAKAFEVTVKTSYPKVTALGFTVNGKKHGGIGTSYKINNMPKGDYEFGIRLKGGKDVACFTKKGEKSVYLKNNTLALLHYMNGKCEVKLN